MLGIKGLPFHFDEVELVADGVRDEGGHGVVGGGVHGIHSESVISIPSSSASMHSNRNSSGPSLFSAR